MKILETFQTDVFLLEPVVYKDPRGELYESFRYDALSSILGRDICFVQENISRSYKNVLRGIHFQSPHPQAKLIHVLKGEVYDVAVDLRPSSPHFGTWFACNLSESNKRMIWIPEGFGHGALSLTEETVMKYNLTDYYNPEGQHYVAWNDPDLEIDWPLDNKPILSEQDRKACLIREIDFQKFF